MISRGMRRKTVIAFGWDAVHSRRGGEGRKEAGEAVQYVLRLFICCVFPFVVGSHSIIVQHISFSSAPFAIV